VYDVRFTSAQYEEAIANLRDAMTQLEPDGRCCVVCGDSGHMAWECGHNPLYAIACCEQIADRATSFHADMHATDEAANVRNVTAEIADQREAAHQRRRANSYQELLSLRSPSLRAHQMKIGRYTQVSDTSHGCDHVQLVAAIDNGRLLIECASCKKRWQRVDQCFAPNCDQPLGHPTLPFCAEHMKDDALIHAWLES
jgi:hypothetical protein